MRDVLEQAVALGKTHTHEGAVATYIPELGKVDGSQLGVSVFLPERQTDFRRGYESPIQYSEYLQNHHPCSRAGNLRLRPGI